MSAAHLRRHHPSPPQYLCRRHLSVNRSTLAAPRYLNWSVALEKKLPAAVFLKLEFIEKRGVHGFAYNTLNGAVDGNFVLENQRDDRYDAFTVSARHRFRQRYEIFGAYTRSRSHTNQVFDFSLDIPLLSQQLPGPYPWDTPNRFVGYGVLPFSSCPSPQSGHGLLRRGAHRSTISRDHGSGRNLSGHDSRKPFVFPPTTR